MGPTVWMTYLAGRRPPVVRTALPAGRRPILATMRLHSSRIEGPPARWMAPSTPPPPRSEELAALTMASVVSLVMSAGPWNSSVLPLAKVSLAAKLGMVSDVGTGGGRGRPPQLPAGRRRYDLRFCQPSLLGNFLCYEFYIGCELVWLAWWGELELFLHGIRPNSGVGHAGVGSAGRSIAQELN